ncbi:hypothetical protein D3C87_1799040 [compost metagenome]
MQFFRADGQQFPHRELNDDLCHLRLAVQPRTAHVNRIDGGFGTGAQVLIQALAGAVHGRQQLVGGVCRAAFSPCTDFFAADDAFDGFEVFFPSVVGNRPGAEQRDKGGLQIGLMAVQGDIGSAARIA